MRLIWVLSFTAAFAASSARAQTSADEQARAIFEAGRTAYTAGRFEDALRYFEESYQLSQRPALLYNIASAADRLNMYGRALETYRTYLAAMPDAENAEFVRGRIAVLETQAPAGGGGGASVAPWIFVGLGAVLVGAGIPMVVIAGNDANAVNTAPDGSSWADYAAAASSAVPLSLSGQVMIYVGAAIFAAGLVWGLVDLSSGGGGESVSLRVGPGSFALAGRFR